MFGFTEEHGIVQASATEKYDVRAGESIYDTLYRHGVIENPMPDVNTYHCEWVANRWWVYRTQIEVAGDRPRVCFEGVDGAFSVFFNNRFLGRHNNSFVPFEVDMSDYGGQTGELTVIVECPEDNLNQSGYTSKIITQRSRYDFKWDFCPRMVSLGLVAPVVLQCGAEITEVKIVADTSGVVTVDYVGKYFPRDVAVSFTVDGKTAVATGESGRLSVRVDSPQLWQCNGRGDPVLYQGVLSVSCGGETLWTKTYNVGFRDLRFVRNENAPEGSLPYTLELNGEKVYIKGVNFVPIEMSRAQMTREKYSRLLTLAKDMHVNLIRIWGGGIVETEDFYDLCDRLGILVWQDFIQSSSGIDNCATVIEEGLNEIVRTAETAVKRIRNHPSLALYCGGNELMDNWVPLGFDHPNIAALKATVDRLDGTRAMLPTTASGPTSGIDLKRVGQGKHHDVHGPWSFVGDPDHYTLYNNSDCLLHGEFGVDGFCNTDAVEKIFTPSQRNFSYISENYIWRHKAEWWDQMPQTEAIFGKCDDVDEQIRLSQFLQAEALRYAVEANRRRAFRNSGSIIWQFDEPYPNLCCTNIVDYFGQPKAVYYTVQRAFDAVNPNMCYEKLCYGAGERFCGELYLTSERCGTFDYTVSLCAGSTHIEKTFTVEVSEAGKSVRVGTVECTVPQADGLHVLLRAKSGEETFRNEILLPVRVGKYCDKRAAIAFVENLKSQRNQ